MLRKADITLKDYDLSMDGLPADNPNRGRMP